MSEETAKEFVERMQKHYEVYNSATESLSGTEIDRLLSLALRGAEATEEDGASSSVHQQGMNIAAEQIPFPVQKALRKILLDGETDERLAVAAALNAWPGMMLVNAPTHNGLILPLTALGEPK